MPTFNPLMQCPVIRNFECIQDECAFWDAVGLQCIYYAGARIRQDYNEATGTIAVVGETLIDLGAVFRNITVAVSGPATLRFSLITNPVITLSATFGRVGVPNMWRNINARYIWLNPSAPPITYLVEGDG